MQGGPFDRPPVSGLRFPVIVKPPTARILQFVAYLLIFSDMNRIIVDPDICNGQPVIKGTRITAQTVLEFLAAGDSVADLLREYPSLTREDVLECVRFSSELMKHHFVLEEVV